MKNDLFDKTIPKNLPLLFRSRVIECGNYNAQASKNQRGEFEFYTYKTVYRQVIAFAAGLRSLGVKRGDNIGIISDNRREWLVTDLAILSLGAADVPRGCDSLGKEIRYILDYADCAISFFENEKQLKKILECVEEVPNLKTAITYDAVSEETIAEANHCGIEVLSFDGLLAVGAKIVRDNESETVAIESEMDKTGEDEVATIIFTSGTTGTPKGVMLTHRNYIAQMEVVKSFVQYKEREYFLSVLPVWHSFERATQYYCITLKCCLAYSKPMASVLLSDIAAIRPWYMGGVPRLFEAVVSGVYRTMKKTGGVTNLVFNFFMKFGEKYIALKDRVTGNVCRFNRRPRFFDALISFVPFLFMYPIYKLGDLLVYKKIRAKFGGKLNVAISGGGALQKSTEIFYKIIGMNILEGYGMTETAPVISVRDYRHSRIGCVGKILPSVEVKIVEDKDGEIVGTEPLPYGKRGLILVRGDQVMKGYYKRPDLTEKVIDKDGWLNTGDIGMFTYDKEIKITGRAKDTIVLLDGENIEPLEIENAIAGSEFVESAVLFGQDKKYLGALIVPNKNNIEAFARENSIKATYYDELIQTPEIQNLFRREIDSRVNSAKGFRLCERVCKFITVATSFAIGDELSAKQEIIRPRIARKYAEQIKKLFAE